MQNMGKTYGSNRSVTHTPGIKSHSHSARMRGWTGMWGWTGSVGTKLWPLIWASLIRLTAFSLAWVSSPPLPTQLPWEAWRHVQLVTLCNTRFQGDTFMNSRPGLLYSWTLLSVYVYVKLYTPAVVHFILSSSILSACVCMGGEGGG